MAVRGDVDFLGILGGYVSISSVLVYSGAVAGGNALSGKPIKTDATGVVAASDGSAIVGQLGHVESDGVCNVQVQGFMKFVYTGVTAAAYGQKIVGSAVAGEVRTAGVAVAAELAAASGKIVRVDVNAVWVLF